MYAVVGYEGELFPGEIIEVIEDIVKLFCMEKCGSVGSTWK